MDPSRIIRFGTDEPPRAGRTFRAGALTLDFSDGGVRHLSWRGIEVVRAIACPIRDADWATLAAVLVEEHITETPDSFEISQVRLVADGALRIKLLFKGDSTGTFHAAAEMSASREFVTNRAGFTLLHPLRGVAGTPLAVTHPGGSTSSCQFPLLIAPDQPAADISGLRYCVDGIDAEIAFQGEIFEMEDQRNWSDASFKTYCRPLSLPKPYRLNPGEVQYQEIHIRLGGMPSNRPEPANGSPVLTLGAVTGRMPQLAMAIDDTSIPGRSAQQITRTINHRILQLRVRPETAVAVCESARANLAGGPAEIELEIVVPSADDPEEALADVAAACKSALLPIARVLALPEHYLRSYQPTGPWPPGPKPQDLWSLVRKSFPRAGLGGGVLTFFPELNRCRPQGSYDYIAHGSTAITHAADDASVIESLEGLGHVFASARALAQDKDYRLGLVAIGMRTNPYGSGVVENRQQNRIAMAAADPRQRGLFAGAWAVGAVAATQGYNVSSLALSTLVGPFGIVHRQEPWLQPFYQDDAGNLVYPLFHVVRFLSAMGGAPRLAFPALGNGIVGVAAQTPSGARLILANLGAGMDRVQLPCKGDVRYLNERNFPSAIRDPQWLDSSEPDRTSDIALGVLDVAFLELPV